MPRKARLVSNSGIYHVMLRGINRQQIFEDVEDNRVFLDFLRKYKGKCEYKLLAYCLMGNHIHLLIREGNEPLGQVFRRIGSRFVYWYNVKYERTGHLFQDRYKSEPVENIGYLCTVIGYIHQNPVKAGICRYPEEYPYSSFQEYLGQPDLIDMDFVEQYVSRETILQKSREQIDEDCLEMNEVTKRRITDQQARQVLMEISKCSNTAEFQALGPMERNNCLRKLKKAGLSLRQISRLTGVSYRIVQKMK